MKFDKTQKVIYEMMTNTNFGRHFLDSGGAYGYRAEKNALIPIDKFFDVPFITLEFNKYGLQGSVSTQRLFEKHLIVDKVCSDFNKKNFRIGIDDEDYDKIYNFFDRKFKIPYDIDIEEEHNTYNDENLLDSTFQYFFINIKQTRYDVTTYIAIAFHSGCDVRGGYQPYRLFLLNEYYEDFLCDWYIDNLTDYIYSDNVVYCNEQWESVKLTKEQNDFLYTVLSSDYSDKMIKHCCKVLDNWDNGEYEREDYRMFIEDKTQFHLW